MLSLQDIAAVKYAIEICNDPELKRKILYAPDGVKVRGDQYNNKQKWDEIVQEQAMVTLRSRGLPKILQEKVMGFVPAIGMRMLTWALYHEEILLFSRQYSIDFLNISLFTQQGIIDNKKAAEELMKDKSLSIKQKYKIACLYCFTDHIPTLFKQIPEEDMKKFCTSIGYSLSELVRFWSHSLMGKVDEVKGEKTLDQYRLEKAIESGCKAAVEYCFEKTNLGMENEAIVDAGVEAMRNRIRATFDWIVFRDWRYDDDYYIHCENLVPSEYYVDIVCFLLSKMTKDQKIEFLKKDIQGIRYERNYFEDHNRSRVLEYFLNWPYQGYFMKTVRLMWEFLPEKNYADLLLKICNKIEPEKEKNLKYVEEKSYDYRGLLTAFWYESPERYKRYVLCNQQIPCQVLIKLLLLKKFFFEDGQIIRMILASAKETEKETILSSEKWRSVLIGLIEEDKLETLDRLDRYVLSHYPYMQVNQFKRKLVYTIDFYRVVFHFLKNDKWDAAESALKWSSLSGEEVNKFKKEMIYSQDGKRACLRLILWKKDVEVTNKFIEWCITSEEEIREYKDELIFSIIGMECCQFLVLEDKLELVDKITDCWIISQEKIKEFRGKFRLLMGENICKKLISGYSERNSCNGVTIKFEGGKWEEVEKFLTWCFSSEEEIVDFKKRLFSNSSKSIVLNLIASSQWAEIETFFAWLGLSINEIQRLKKDTVLDRGFISFFRRLMRSEDDDPFFVHYGSKKEGIELILRWCLTDKETVFEFKQKFKEEERGGLYRYVRMYLGDLVSNFNLIIEQRLKDILEEQTIEKRKSETVFSPNKKLCNFKQENFG